MKPRKVDREEIWASMDQDTRDFITALCAPFEATVIVEEKRKDRPQPVKVEKKIKTRVTLKAIKLESQGIYWTK